MPSFAAEASITIEANDCSVGPCGRPAGNESRDRNTGIRRVEPRSEYDYGAQTSPGVRPNGPKLSAAIATVRQYGQEHGRARGSSVADSARHHERRAGDREYVSERQPTTRVSQPISKRQLLAFGSPKLVYVSDGRFRRAKAGE